MADIGATLHDHFGSIELEGVKLAFLHGDDSTRMRDVERSGYYDFLFYGHTHQAEEHQQRPDAHHQSRRIASSADEDVCCAGSGEQRSRVGDG